MTIIKIGGREFKGLTSYNANLTDLDSSNSTRNEAGVMFRDRLRANIVKISLAFSFLSFEEGCALLQAVSPAQFNVEYLSPLTGQLETGTFYAGDRNTDLKANAEGLQIWTNISFNLVEF